MKPVVDRATLDDLDALAPLFDGYRQFYEQPSDIQRAHAGVRLFIALGLVSYIRVVLCLI